MNKEFGNKVKSLLIIRNIKNKDFAAFLGISHFTLSKILNGHIKIPKREKQIIEWYNKNLL